MLEITLAVGLAVLTASGSTASQASAEGHSAQKRGALPAEVYVLGTVHSFHERESFAYSYADLADQVRAMRPTLVCAEMSAEDQGGEHEAMYPLEVAVVEEAAQSIRAAFLPADWRPSVAEAQTAALQKEMTADEQVAFDHVYDDFMPRLQAAGHRFFELWHSPETQEMVRGLHDKMIALGTEAGAGFWETRNQIIVKRCIRKAMADDLERVLFVFGAEHKYVLEQYLRRFYGIEARPVTRLFEHKNRPVSAAIVARWTKARDNLARSIATGELPAYFADQFNDGYVARLTATIDAQGRAH